MESLGQAVIKEEDIRSQWSGGIQAISKVTVFVTGFPDNSEEKHASRQKEIQGIDSSKGADPKVLEGKHLLFAAEVFFDFPAGKIQSHSHD